MIDYNRQAQIIEEEDITDNLKLTISVTFDETKVFMDINYMDGKFTIQKSFTNNYIGLEELETIRKQFNNEEAVRSYFNLEG